MGDSNNDTSSLLIFGPQDQKVRNDKNEFLFSDSNLIKSENISQNSSSKFQSSKDRNHQNISQDHFVEFSSTHDISETNTSGVLSPFLLKLKSDNGKSLYVDSVNIPWADYLSELASNFFATSSTRSKQARLSVWELLELFDFFNDFHFLVKVVTATLKERKTAQSASAAKALLGVGYSASIFLTVIYIITIVGYSFRRWLIFHRIPSRDTFLFVPFASIKYIKICRLDSLHMFERLVWTYQLVMRLMEDIPQVLVSAFFMVSFGKDAYSYFTIAYSILLLMVTSYRMGLNYPFFGTLSLLISRTPPIDSADISEAAPTTRYFCLYVSFSFFLWSAGYALCSHFWKKYFFWGHFFFFSCIFCALGAFLICLQWIALSASAHCHDFIDSNGPGREGVDDFDDLRALPNQSESEWNEERERLNKWNEVEMSYRTSNNLLNKLCGSGISTEKNRADWFDAGAI